jgi:hypothetical protein
MASDGRMISECWFGKNVEAIGQGLTEVTAQNLPGGTEDTTKTSVRVAGVPTQIRTKHPQNEKLELDF